MRVLLTTIKKTSPVVGESIKKAGEMAYEIADRHGLDIFHIISSKQKYDVFVSSKKAKIEKQNKQNYL